MVLLTFYVLIRLVRERVRLSSEGKIDPSFFRLFRGSLEPESSAKIIRNFTNLLEVPVLFYVCCLSALVIKGTGIFFLLLAWAYVASRMIHTFIHIGNNSVRPRIFAYTLSWLILLAMWVLLVIHVVFMT